MATKPTITGDILLGERKPALPAQMQRSVFEAMARRRHQSPTPFIHGDYWVINYRIDVFKDGELKRVQKQQQLAPANTKLREVQRLRDDFISPLNHGSSGPGSAVTFKDFVEQVYNRNKIPLLEGGGSQDRYQGVLRNYLVPAFGGKMLRELSYDTVQAFFTGLIKQKQEIQRGKNTVSLILSKDSRHKIWTVFSSVMTHARKGGHVLVNPAENIDLGRDRRGSMVQLFISPKQFHALITKMQEPYATMLYVAVFTGLRVSELAGLRYENIDGRVITVVQKYSRGFWGEPKSDKSNASIIVAKSVIDRICSLRGMKTSVRAGNAVRVFDVVKSSEPRDLVFQGVWRGQPMNDQNILRRHIKPAGAAIGVPGVNWLAMRRSTSTWHKRAGTHIKDAQMLLRHENEATTLRHYTQIEFETQVEAVDRLEAYMQREVRAMVN
jgi:integrase